MKALNKLLFSLTLCAGMIAGIVSSGYGYRYESFDSNCCDGLSKMLIINVYHTDDSTDEHLQDLLGNYPNKSRIKINFHNTINGPTNDPILTNDVIEYLKSLPKLVWLELGDDDSYLQQMDRRNPLINDTLLTLLPKTLTTLKLNDCHQITKMGLAHLPGWLKNLELNCCIFITDEDIASLPKGLRDLKLEYCFNIIKPNCLPSYLKGLTFVNCFNLTKEVFNCLPPQLRILRIWNCSKISEMSVQRFFAEHPELTVDRVEVVF